jgi:hypothetical protein
MSINSRILKIQKKLFFIFNGLPYLIGLPDPDLKLWVSDLRIRKKYVRIYKTAIHTLLCIFFGEVSIATPLLMSPFIILDLSEFEPRELDKQARYQPEKPETGGPC